MSSFWKNQTINSYKYCFQLELDEKCQELINWKSINLHVDNVKPHVSLMTRQKLLQLGWEILIQLPYSLDIIPSGINLFWFLQNSLNGKIFSSLEDCKRHLEHFFTQNQKVLGRWKYEVVWKIAEGRGVLPDVRIPEREERRLPKQCTLKKKGSLLLTRIRAPAARPTQWYGVREPWAEGVTQIYKVCISG